jgi:hypothetical protein
MEQVWVPGQEWWSSARVLPHGRAFTLVDEQEKKVKADK